VEQYEANLAAGSRADATEEEEPAAIDCDRILACQCRASSQIEYFNAAQRKWTRDKKREMRRRAEVALREAGSRRSKKKKSGGGEEDGSEGSDDGGSSSSSEGSASDDGERKTAARRRDEPTFDLYASDSGSDSDDSAMFAGVIGTQADVEAARQRADLRRRIRQAEKEKKAQSNALKRLLEVCT